MSPVIKSVICVVCAVFFVIINTIILFLKPEFVFAKNDDDNYNVFYQKWIGTVVFMATITIALFCIYFSISLKLIISYSLLTIECLLLVIYALCKYKCVTVNGDDIKVQRLFRKELNTKFSKISLVTYYPNDENNVYLTKFNMSIKFPEKMFREYYQQHSYFRNSVYLFSARSLENKEYIEGYLKESNKDITEFTELVKNDLALNEYKFVKEQTEVIDGYEFIVLKSISKLNPDEGRIAFIYNDKKGKYFVLYTNYLLKEEMEFYSKMKIAIHRPLYEDGKSRLVRV